MRYLFALYTIFFCSTAFGQSFGISPRIGLVPYSNPLGVGNQEGKKTGPGVLFGLKLARETKRFQVGVSADWFKLPENNYIERANAFVNPALIVNYKTNPSKTFFFFGGHGGMLIPDGYYPGFSLGAQAGGQVELAPHFQACVEASFRYGNFMGNIDRVSFFYFPVVLSVKLEV